MKARKLSVEEVEALEHKSPRSIKAELYDSLVADFAEGEYGMVSLGIDEKKLTIRSNITKALNRRGLGVNWLRVSPKTPTSLPFQVVPDPATGNVH